ncbi:MAG: hypothetical protein GY926_25820 [bacterium]|nr:hypothetical protein [bacterium]
MATTVESLTIELGTSPILRSDLSFGDDVRRPWGLSVSDSKRFIITFVKEEVTTASAARILGVAKSRFHDGAVLLESEAELNEMDVLHFEELGASVATLSEEKAEEPRGKASVAEVVEDFEVHALGEATPNSVSTHREITLGAVPTLTATGPTNPSCVLRLRHKPAAHLGSAASASS